MDKPRLGDSLDFMNEWILHRFIFVFGGDYKEAVKSYQQLIEENYFFESPPSIAEGVVHMHGPYSNVTLIWFRDTLPTNSIIVHECFHALTKALRCIDVNLSENTEELFAYGMGYLMRKIDEYFKITPDKKAKIAKRK